MDKMMLDNERMLADFLIIASEPQKIRKYSRKVSIIDLLRYNMRTARNKARKEFPCQLHEIPDYINWCGQCSCYYWQEYTELRDSEFFKIHGRKYNTSDYQISGVCRNEFSNETKEKLREYLHKANDYERLGKLFSLIPKGSKA